MREQPHEITSLRELQRRVPSFVQALNANERLIAGAAANPLFALEELGFTIAPALLPTVVRRIRFSQAVFERLETLAEQVQQQAQQRFDLDAPAELARVLFEALKLPRDATNLVEQAATAAPEYSFSDALTSPLPYHLDKAAANRPDPLEKLRGQHPVIEPLLAYRALEATTPRLASREDYQRIRVGAVKLPITHFRAVLKRIPLSE